MPRAGSALLFTAAALLLAGPALAVPITYELQQGVENGFGFSGLHDADDSTPMSGASLGDLYGSLTLDWDAGTNNYVFESSTVWLDSNEYTFEIVGGVLQASGSGFLSFVLAGAGAFAQEGEIVFTGGSPVCCGPGGPNYVGPTELRLWGAVDIPASGGVAGETKRFGMDLAANAIPEPSAAIVFALGTLVFRAGLRRRACS